MRDVHPTQGSGRRKIVALVAQFNAFHCIFLLVGYGKLFSAMKLCPPAAPMYSSSSPISKTCKGNQVATGRVSRRRRQDSIIAVGFRSGATLTGLGVFRTDDVETETRLSAYDTAEPWYGHQK
jgi:hypothetical protein